MAKFSIRPAQKKHHAHTYACAMIRAAESQRIKLRSTRSTTQNRQHTKNECKCADNNISDSGAFNCVNIAADHTNLAKNLKNATYMHNMRNISVFAQILINIVCNRWSKRLFVRPDGLNIDNTLRAIRFHITEMREMIRENGATLNVKCSPNLHGSNVDIKRGSITYLATFYMIDLIPFATTYKGNNKTFKTLAKYLRYLMKLDFNNKEYVTQLHETIDYYIDCTIEKFIERV